MERVYCYTMKCRGDDYDYDYAEWLETPEGMRSFYVHNIEEMSDAVVGRDLFSSQDYVDAVNDGIQLGRAGYTSAEIVDVVKCEDEF